MATHVGMYGVNLRGIHEVYGDGPARVSLADGEGGTVDLVGPLLELREVLGAALDGLDALSRERSKRAHPSMFDPCDGGSQPDAAVRWLTPGQAKAVADLNEAMDDLAAFDNAFQPGFRHREEQDRILDAMDNEYGGDAA